MSNRGETIQVLDKGFVRLVDWMGEDSTVVETARVSYSEGTRKVSSDQDLIRYMMRSHHTSPFEHVIFRFHVKAPIFVFRQWHRHRTWSYSEISGRYSVLKDEFFVPLPSDVRAQSQRNKQGSEGMVSEEAALQFVQNVIGNANKVYGDYETSLEAGVSREMARISLPVATYSEMQATVDLHNLFHYMGLRMDPHAQEEIRAYAHAMFYLIRPIVPICCQAFLDYRLNAMTLSALEIEAIKSGQPLSSDNKRERDEWEEKKARLGIKT